MTNQERDATLALCLMAAMADGGSDEKERAQIERIAGTLSAGADADMPALYRDVASGKLTAEATAAQIGSPEAKQLAYEMAVCVCGADGAHTEAEKRFLGSLRGALGLEAARAEAFTRDAAELAAVPLEGGPRALPGAPPPDPAALDQMILSAAITNGALELLPESLASMAIIPMQMRLVYRIGKAHGYELDRGHVKDFLATAGVGLASQYVEQVGRKLLGGLLGKIGGGLLGGLGRQATSSAFAFASTYALGHVAKRYYQGGRTLSAESLRQAFQEMLGQARTLQQRYTGEIEAKARTIDVSSIKSLIQQ